MGGIYRRTKFENFKIFLNFLRVKNELVFQFKR
jgi:hypothetical protein